MSHWAKVAFQPAVKTSLYLRDLPCSLPPVITKMGMNAATCMLGRITDRTWPDGTCQTPVQVFQSTALLAPRIWPFETLVSNRHASAIRHHHAGKV